MAQTTTALFVIVAALTAPPLARQSPPPVDQTAQPVALLDNVDLMDLMVKPAYDELRDAMGRPPADRQAWAALYQKAARLAELENLLFFRTRPDPSRRVEWAGQAARARQAAADVATTAMLGLRNARSGDFDLVRDKFPAIAAGCTACHRAFAREAPTIRP